MGNFAYTWLTTDGPIHINRAIVAFLPDHIIQSITALVIFSILGGIAWSRQRELPPDTTPSTTTTLGPGAMQTIGVGGNTGSVTIVNAPPSASPYAHHPHLNRKYDHFFELFQSHGIKHEDIPFLLRNFGVTLPILNDTDRVPLLNCLNNPLIDFLAQSFHVSVDWLRGTSDIPTVEIENWYNAPRDFCCHLAQLRRISHEITVLFVKGVSSDLTDAFVHSDSRPQADVGIIVKIEHVDLDHATTTAVRYHTYEWWGYQRWNYKGARVQLKALILFCVKFHISRRQISWLGINIDDDAMTHLKESRILPVDAYGRGNHSIWFPNEYVLPASHPALKENADLPATFTIYNDLKLDECFQ